VSKITLFTNNQLLSIVIHIGGKMKFQLLLKLIPAKLILATAWKILKPILLEKIEDTESSIDDKVFKEISDLIEELLK